MHLPTRPRDLTPSRPLSFVLVLVIITAMLALFTPGAASPMRAGRQQAAPQPLADTMQSSIPLAAGYWHTCAVTSGGGVKCWGDNNGGQLGDGTRTDRSTPVDVSGLTSAVTALALGVEHTCAVTSDGGAKCWGNNSYGQLGDGTATYRRTPVDVMGLTSGVIALATGYGHTCAVTSGGGVKCWGDNDTGQLGDGTTTDRWTPVDVSELGSGVTALAAGLNHTCAVTSDGGAKCWGNNHRCQLGDGTCSSRATPAAVRNLTSGVTALTAGWFHTCALTRGGGVKCWGDNSAGQLGDGTTNDDSSPVDVSGLGSGVTALAAGYYHTCAVTSGGGVKCWGNNYNGQLGDGTTINRWTPVDVSGPGSGVTALAAGKSHTCAITSGGGVKCWGNNYNGQLGDGTTTDRWTPVDVVGIGTVTPNPTPAPPPVPGNNVVSVPGKPTQSRTVNSVTVHADNFIDNGGGWSASGTVWIGDYTIVENGSVSASGNSLTGSGQVSMITSADNSKRTLLFRDNFDVNIANGTLTPKFVSGYEFSLKNLVGFRISQDAYQVAIDVRQGQFSGTLNLEFVIPLNKVVKAVSFTLDRTGAIGGSLTGSVGFKLGKVDLQVDQATIGTNGLAIKRAALQLPAGLGGAKAALSVTSARITSDGQLSLGGGSVSINFPNVRVGGAQGFAIEGATATLSVANGEYRFRGAGTFMLPGIGTSTGGCRIGTSFEFSSTPPPLREAGLSVSGCFRIPLGSTGFFLTSVNGKVTLDETSVAVDVGIGIEGGPSIPRLGAAISGSPQAHWDNSWKVGISGNLKVFRWEAANASLSLSPREGLIGTLNLRYGLLFDAHGRLHVWKDASAFHFTGHADVGVKVPKGSVLNKCTGIGFTVCVSIPPADINGPRASADFGEFRTPSSSSTYGMKGKVSVLGYEPAFFIDVEGNIRYDLGGLEEYRLVDQAALVGVHPEAVSDAVYPVTVGNTPALLVAMGRDSGDLTLTLTDPTGRTITPTTSDPTIFYTSTLTQTLYSIANPQPGNWQVTVGNRSGSEHYLLDVLGAPIAPSIPQAPTLAASSTGYDISLQATGAPTATYSLFYDDDAQGNDGKPIATGLPISQTSASWDTSRVPQGTYYVYALLDDPFNAPVVAYSTAAVTISDSTAPDAPTNLQVTSTGTDATIAWQKSTVPDVAGYRIQYREPNGGQRFVVDVPDPEQTSYTQQGLYLNGGWEITVSAYDINGNESAQSSLAIATINIAQPTIYLPLVQR